MNSRNDLTLSQHVQLECEMARTTKPLRLLTAYFYVFIYLFYLQLESYYDNSEFRLEFFVVKSVWNDSVHILSFFYFNPLKI